MSLLDRKFKVLSTRGLPVWQPSVPGESTLEPGYLYRIDGSDASAPFGIAEHAIADVVNMRIALKVVTPAETEPGALSLSAPEGQLIEDTSGNLTDSAGLGSQELGTFFEWICDPDGNWLLISRFAGSTMPLGQITIQGVPVVIGGVPLVITPPALARTVRGPVPVPRPPLVTPLVGPKPVGIVPVPRAAVTPRSLTIELADAFDDLSLEMNAGGDKFRVAAALQAAIVAAADAADDAAAAAAAAQATATAAGSAASAAQSTANTAVTNAAAAQADVDAHEANTSNPHAVTKTQVGLSAVTNDAQLKRAAGDIATFTAKTTLANADLFLIEDSAASGAKKQLSYSDLRAALVLASGSTGNPYIDPPTTPNAWDDEFNSGSPDLATRGWTIKTLAGATLTRAGDIAPWDTTGPAAGTYWSTIIGSWLFIQGPASTQYYIYKSITLAVGDSYFMRAGSPYRLDSGASGRYREVALWANNAGVPDPANRVYVSTYELNTAPVNLDMGRNLANVFGGTSRNKWYDADIFGVYYKASTNDYRTFAVNSNNGDSVTLSPAGGPSAANLVYFGISNVAGAAAATPTVLAVDCARKKTSHAWIVP